MSTRDGHPAEDSRPTTHNAQRTTHNSFASILGADHVWEATAKDAIDGVRPELVVEPGSVEEAAAVLRLANEQGLAVAPRGGGTKLGWGNPPERLDLILSMRRLSSILEHASGDLVVRVQAGARLEDVQQELRGTGQWLALDPPHEGATIGGIIAANASGPHRLRYGTARDLLIGLTYILPDGTVAKSGGKVVKNVAGYDLGKLFTGSLGTLGLIAEAIFRLHPLPQASSALLWAGKEDEFETLSAMVQDILRSAIVPAALQYSWSRTHTTLALFLEGVEAGVGAQRELAATVMGRHGGRLVRSENNEATRQTERMATAFTQSSEPEAAAACLKVSHVLADLPAVIQTVRNVTRDRALYTQVYGHAASGISRVIVSPTEIGEGREAARSKQIAAIREIRGAIAARGGSVVMLDAPLRVKRAIDVWGDTDSSFPLMRRVKERFDPNRIMNPGRFIGGI